MECVGGEEEGATGTPRSSCAGSDMCQGPGLDAGTGAQNLLTLKVP